MGPRRDPIRHPAAPGRTRQIPAWVRTARRGILVAVVSGAWLLRHLGASGWAAAGLALGFGALGVAVMVLWSRRLGAMVHCTVYCPLGLVADVLGKVSPFRVRIGAGCTECGLCTRACRYDALSLDDLRRRRPGPTCTLCGDCLGTCREGQLELTVLGLRHRAVRPVFLALVVALHAAFLGVARM